MQQSNEYYAQLLADYLNNACTPQQVQELMQWLQQDAANRVLLQQLQVEFNKAMETNAALPFEISNRLRARLMQFVQPPAPRFYKRLFFRAAAAAILILMLGAGWFYFLNKEPVKEVTSGKVATGAAQPAITKKNGRIYNAGEW